MPLVESSLQGGIGMKAKKSSAGYNLTELFIGSEGTLGHLSKAIVQIVQVSTGVITAATVRLHAMSEAQMAGVVQFPTIKHAVNSVVAFLQNSLQVARMEFLDAPSIEACNSYSGTQYEIKLINLAIIYIF